MAVWLWALTSDKQAVHCPVAGLDESKLVSEKSYDLTYQRKTDNLIVGPKGTLELPRTDMAQNCNRGEGNK
jgi:hypothetical protein